MQSSSQLYFARLDHLRFVAAFLVFYWHAGHWWNVYPTGSVPSFFAGSIFEEGHTGVALFMVLSGFIFCAICGDKVPIYGEFLRNRLLRIAPLFTIWTLFGYSVRPDVTPERLFATIFGLLNKNSYPGLGWTVLIEFQFYLIFPFLLAFSRRYGTRYLVGLVGTIVMLRWLFWNQYGSVQYMSYWTIVGRIDQFVLGMVGYSLYRRYHPWLGSIPFFVSLVVVWLAIYHVINLNGGYYGIPTSPYFQTMWIFVPTLEGLFYMLITVSYLRLQIRIAKWLNSALAWLGMLSYSLYLNHDTVVTACYKWATYYKLPVNTPVTIGLYAVVAVFPVLVAVSAATYYFIEKPFLNLRRAYLVDRTLAPNNDMR
jgi:peptidoglycan/LPS O-acetylase OafA/YrhL